MQVTTRLLIFLAILGLARPGWADEVPDPGRLRLADVERLVVERNRALVGARRATQAAEAGMDAAAARPNPIVSLNTSGIGTKRSAGSGNLDTVLRIDQPIERGGKRQLRLAVADSLLEASHADENDALRQQRLLARQAYFDLKAAEDKARLAAESARLAHEVLAKAELRQRAGDLSPVDVARIRTDALKADGDARQAQVDRQRARLTLAQLLALEAEAPRLATADPWPRLDPLPAAEPDLSQRPDVAAASRRLEAARTGIDLAKSLRVRDVTVGAQVERDNSTETRAGNMVGFGVSIPLFTGYDYRGEIRRAHVDRDAAADDLERLKATAAAEVVQAAFEANELSERARRLQDEALPAARKTSAAVQFAFTQGAASVLDVIDARRSLHVVETDTANALADAAKARAAWAAALNRSELP
ncbi:MAG TPA: TolC family protein [Rhodocyclaceae bacterium]|nr:TolC family protein [Rhodocyclaceae bacterium]